MKKSYSFAIAILLGLLIVPLVLADVNELEPVKQGQCKLVRQTCSSCSYVNISVTYPNSTLAVTNQGMNNAGGGLWTYSFCNTGDLGRYDVMGSGDLSGTDTSFDAMFFNVRSYLDNVEKQDNFPMYMLLGLIVIIFAYYAVSKFIGSMGMFVLGFGILFRESTIGWLGWLIIAVGFIMLVYSIMASPKKKKIRRFR